MGRIAEIINADARKIEARARLLEAENRKRAGEVKILLQELEEYFDQRADAEYFTSSPAPVPNAEMKLLTKIRSLLEDKTNAAQATHD